MAQHLEDLCRTLIAFDTVSSHSNLEAARFVADHLDANGFRVRLQVAEAGNVQKANVVASVGPPEPSGLIVSGHLDVVPFEGQTGWERDPLAFGSDGDRFYGRGTSDMKVFVAQCLEVAKGIRPDTFRRPLVFVFTFDEEVGAIGAQRFVDEIDDLLDGVPRPSLAWIGEPTSFRVFTGHKGSAIFGITVRGLGGHDSVPTRGINAIAAACRVVEIIGRFQRELCEKAPAGIAKRFADAPYSTINVATIQGGVATNLIPERCQLLISYRPLPGEDPRTIHAEIERRLLDAEIRGYDGLGSPASVEVGPPFVLPSMLAPSGTLLEHSLLRHGGRQSAGGAPFATDGGRFAAAGIDSIICGPGDLEQAHQPNESIPARALARGTELLGSVIADLCAGATAPESVEATRK